MIQQTITVNQNLVRDVQRRLGTVQRKAPNAIASALNRSLTKLTTSISKEIREGYHIKAADIKKTITKRNANANDLKGAIKSRGRVIGLDHFKKSKTKKVLKVAVKKNGLKPIKNAFIGDANGSKIFVRTTKKRLPIKRLYGPSVPQMFKSREVKEKLAYEADLYFKNRLDHEINRLVERG